MGKQFKKREKAVKQLSFTKTQRGYLQRKCVCGQHTIAGGNCEECHQKCEGTLQRAAVNATHTPSVPLIVHDVLSSPGQPLDAGTRAFMEPRFGHDFSGVRVHTDARAAESAWSVNALAYTVGRNVVFGAGQYTPGTSEGRRLLVHELAHVVQQRPPSTNANTHLTIDSDNSPFEREASIVANNVGYTQPEPIQLQGYNGLQRQVASTSLAQSTPWDNLPTRAQKNIEKDYFNNLDPDTQKAFQSLYYALEAENLWGEIVHITDVRIEETRDLKCTVKDSMISQLFSHPHFCRDTQIGGLLHKGEVTWRQVVTAGTEGLHIGIAGPNAMTAHLDTISPTAERETDGLCRYSMPHFFPHFSRDVVGWHNLELFPLPTEETKPGDIQSMISIRIPHT